MTESDEAFPQSGHPALPLSSARLSDLLGQAGAMRLLADYGIAARDIDVGIALTINAEQTGVIGPALEWQRQFAQIAAAARVRL